ncbi:MAG TPA: peptide chain release factor N(5)-glutamine methyltransferase [Pseudomonadales bacterium]|nr:peptide chain release factor N(5)-glutamine methyltransferase [Pseudomonadales bacterium]
MRNYDGTIADHLRVATLALQGACDEPRREAEILLSVVLACDRAYFIAYGDRTITNSDHDLFCHYVERRQQGEPVAYIIGQREFWSLPLAVNNSTLIPRHDTEVLVEKALDYCVKEQAYVLDLGTGTGAIALALASERSAWEIDAVDVQEDAVALAKFNVSQLGLKNISVYRSHWFSEVEKITTAPGARFDLIVSNPPYIDEKDAHLRMGDVRFEPRSALVADEEGYADLFFIARMARRFLVDDGLLLMEHAFSQGERLRNYLLEIGYSNVATFFDYGGNERVTVAKFCAPLTEVNFSGEKFL